MNSFVQNGNEELELTDGQLEAIFGAEQDGANGPDIDGPGINTYGSDANGSILSNLNTNIGLLDNFRVL